VDTDERQVCKSAAKTVSILAMNMYKKNSKIHFVTINFTTFSFYLPVIVCH
jgi:hypothetical protein